MSDDLFNGPASITVRAFVAELEELCDKYGYTLSTSGYDGLQIWRRDATSTSPILAAGIEDMTSVADGGGKCFR